MFAVAAARTDRVLLTTNVLPTYTRHPLVTAMQALTSQAAAGGRLIAALWYKYGARQILQFSVLWYVATFLNGKDAAVRRSKSRARARQKESRGRAKA